MSLKKFTFTNEISEEYLCNQCDPAQERIKLDSLALSDRTNRLTDFRVKKEDLGLTDHCYVTKFMVTNNSTIGL